MGDTAAVSVSAAPWMWTGRCAQSDPGQTETLVRGSFPKMSHVGNLQRRNPMCDRQLVAQDLPKSASEIATAIRAVPLSTPHAHATQLLMSTRRRRGI